MLNLILGHLDALTFWLVFLMLRKRGLVNVIDVTYKKLVVWNIAIDSDLFGNGSTAL